jgi:Tol biopolymer transport system component
MMAGFRRRTAVIAGSVLALGTLSTVSMGADARSVGRGAAVTNGRIAFQAEVRRNPQIFTIRPDGRGLKQVTDLRGDDPGPGAGEPAWAPNGTRIALNTETRFTAPLFTRVNLFTVASDGSGLTELPLGVGNFNGDPAYSPDGKQISFDQDVGKREPTAHGIYIADSDGTDARRLTTGLQTTKAYDTESQWSPDGNTIAFTRVKNNKEAAVFAVRVDGTELTQLTPYRLDAASPDWSPNGKRIVFNSYYDSPGGKPARVFTMRPDGSKRKPITDARAPGGPVFSFRPSWSPDGTRIVFVRAAPKDKTGENYRIELHTMTPRGGKLERLTQMPGGFPANPDWGTAP